MIWLFEVAGMAALAGVVWILFRAADQRPDQPGMRRAAWLGASVWLGFAALLLVEGGAFDDFMALARNALIATVILATVLGYRRVLGLIKARAGDR